MPTLTKKKSIASIKLGSGKVTVFYCHDLVSIKDVYRGGENYNFQAFANLLNLFFFIYCITWHKNYE